MASFHICYEASSMFIHPPSHLLPDKQLGWFHSLAAVNNAINMDVQVHILCSILTLIPFRLAEQDLVTVLSSVFWEFSVLISIVAGLIWTLNKCVDSEIDDFCFLGGSHSHCLRLWLLKLKNIEQFAHPCWSFICTSLLRRDYIFVQLSSEFLDFKCLHFMCFLYSDSNAFCVIINYDTY